MAELLKVSANTSRELRATVQGLKRLPRDLQANIRKYTKSEMAPEWQRGLAEHAISRTQHRALVDTARVTVSNQNVMLKSATVGKPLRGGLDPKSSWAALEFGADRGIDAKTTYTATSRKGRAYKVTRNTRRQLPPRSRTGWVIFPTARDLTPRFLSLWVQTTFRTIYEAIERK